MTKKEDEPMQTVTSKDNLKNQGSNIKNRDPKYKRRGNNEDKRTV